MVSRYNAIKTIGDRAVQKLPGPTSFGSVSNAQLKTTYDIYRVTLPLFHCLKEMMQFLWGGGGCLDQITVQFSKYPLQGTVEKDFRNRYKQIGGDMKNLRKLARHAGGNTDS